MEDDMNKKDEQGFEIYGNEVSCENSETAEAEPESAKSTDKKNTYRNFVFYKLVTVVIISIFYVLILTFAAPYASDIKEYIKDKLANDFSFSNSVYKTVENISSYFEFDKSAKGGKENPVSKNELPANATFAPVIFTGKIEFPLKDEYHVSSKFGFRTHPITGGNDFHTAADLATSKGTPIYAALSGKVVRARKDSSLGNFVKIEHKNGFYTLYGHCDKLLVKEGVYVRTGEVIAKVGSTGDSTGNHLHFATIKDGLYFDPCYIFTWLYDNI